MDDSSRGSGARIGNLALRPIIRRVNATLSSSSHGPHEAPHHSNQTRCGSPTLTPWLTRHHILTIPSPVYLQFYSPGAMQEHHRSCTRRRTNRSCPRSPPSWKPSCACAPQDTKSSSSARAPSASVCSGWRCRRAQRVFLENRRAKNQSIFPTFSSGRADFLNPLACCALV